MKKLNIVLTALAFLLVAGISTDTFAQGRRGGGRPSSNPSSSRPTTSPGVDKGIGTASQRSNGRSDEGSGTATRNSDGRSDAGIDRARLMRDNRDHADREIRENPRLQEITKLNANDLRDGYDLALDSNPRLKFGQFVAANMIVRNLNGRFSNVTTWAILDGLADGRSIGRTLRDLGMSKKESKRAVNLADRQIEDARH